MVLSNSELHGKAPCLSGSLEPCWSWCLNSWLAKVLPRWFFTAQSSSWVMIVNIVLTTGLGMLYRYTLPPCTGFLVSFWVTVATSFHCENQGQLRDATSGSLCPPECSCSLSLCSASSHKWEHRSSAGNAWTFLYSWLSLSSCSACLCGVWLRHGKSYQQISVSVLASIFFTYSLWLEGRRHLAAFSMLP